MWLLILKNQTSSWDYLDHDDHQSWSKYWRHSLFKTGVNLKDKVDSHDDDDLWLCLIVSKSLDIEYPAE